MNNFWSISFSTLTAGRFYFYTALQNCVILYIIVPIICHVMQNDESESATGQQCTVELLYTFLTGQHLNSDLFHLTCGLFRPRILKHINFSAKLLTQHINPINLLSLTFRASLVTKRYICKLGFNPGQPENVVQERIKCYSGG